MFLRLCFLSFLKYLSLLKRKLKPQAKAFFRIMSRYLMRSSLFCMCAQLKSPLYLDPNRRCYGETDEGRLIVY